MRLRAKTLSQGRRLELYAAIYFIAAYRRTIGRWPTLLDMPAPPEPDFIFNLVRTGHGLGNLGAEQLAWLEADLKDKSNSTPIVVFAHIPLQVIYKEWGWGTEDGMQALALLKRFGSVTILNGHIHQLAQKVEGNMTFHTALSTAFPQPAPGSAPSPGPMLVPADKLRTLLGLSTVTVVQGNKPLAIIDKTLAG